jgi:hypothetical protein
MRKFSVIPLIAALGIFASCQKQQTEEERKAEVERQVQERLAAEKLETDKQSVVKQQAELDAREKALAEREAASPTPVEEPITTPTQQVTAERSEAPAESNSTATYGMFYEKLDPYGEWRETSAYGYVWQPREAETSADWRPYTEGRWVYSDAGWTWVSDEKFGWATYHYGRWVRLHRVGWVWVPGEEWAPAWVSWRTNKEYVGWAPLPPEARFDRRSGIHNWADSYYDIGPAQYSFVASNDFGAEHLRHSVVPAERNINIIIETTNVTRITFSNTMVMNEGPSYEELRSRSQRPIERYRLRRDQNMEAPARVAGGELEVAVPILSDVHNVYRPVHVKERVTDVNVDNGWTSVSDRAAAERARTKIRTEATPPPNAPPKKFVPPVEKLPTSAASPPPASATAAASATATSAPARSTKPIPATTAAHSATPSPAASASPKTRPSPSARPSPTPSPAASPTVTVTVPPAVSNTPRTRPSPSLPARTSSTPAVPLTTPTVPRKAVPPVLSTPTATVPPVAEKIPSPKPVPTLTPVKRPSIPPRTLPSPTVMPEKNNAAQPPVPRRTPPQRMTPTPAVTNSPSAPNEVRTKDRRPPRPVSVASGTPTAVPSTPPN